jgi:LysR family transcriptional regulator AphB
LSKFVDAYPDLSLQLETYSSGFEREPKEDIDVFFKVRQPRNSSRRIRSYPSILHGLYASREYVQKNGAPVRVADLAPHRCIGLGSWTLSDRKTKVTPELAFHIVTDDPYVLRQLVLDGAGIAALPLWMVFDSVTADSLVRILPAWQPAPVTLCALYSVSSRLIPKVKVFLDFIEKYLGTDQDPRLHGASAKDCFSRSE